MKPRNIFSIVLIAGIIVLAYFLYKGIMRPLKFESEYNKRSTAVINKLKDIRTIQETFKSTHGRYCGDMDSLLLFLEEGKVNMVLKFGVLPDSLTESQALKAGVIKRDTVTVNPMKKLVDEKKLITPIEDIQNLKYIPNSNNMEFELEAAILETSGIMVPVFEVRAPLNTFTKGMNEQDVINRKAEIIAKSRYPGWKVGDMQQPVTDGNWE